MARKHILIVEDDQSLNLGIRMALSGEAKCTACMTAREAKTALIKSEVDLIVLDINLPDGNGLDLLQSLRERSDVPVILLTANDLETDVVTGLSMGADDYVTKPFSLAILRARVQVQLRKKGKETVYRQGGYAFSFEDHEFSKDGAPISLSRTEEKILQTLVKNRGRAVPRGQLLAAAWGNDCAYVEENALSVSVNRLRSKLGEKDCIRTVYGIGYCWEAGE